MVDQQVQTNVTPPQEAINIPSVQRKSLLPLILIGVVLILIVGGGMYYLGQKSKTNQTIALPISITPTSGPTTEPTMARKLNLKTYTNQTYGYSFQYPADWVLDASKAEPATANNAPASPDTSMVTLTKNGYEFSFIYNLSGVGGGAVVIAKQGIVLIGNTTYSKVYLNTLANPACIPPYAGSINPTPKQECYSEFNQININPYPLPTGTTGGSTLMTFNSKLSSITLRLPKLTSVNDTEFEFYDKDFDNILSTLQFLSKSQVSK